MVDPRVVRCKACGKGNRVRSEAAGAPVCGSCGTPLPWIVEADESSFRPVVEESPLPVLVDFWAPWCGPCRVVSPVVEQLGADLAGRLKVAKVNTDDAPGLQRRFGVRGIPTLMLVSEGRERDRVVGAQGAAALRSWLESRLPTSSPAS